MSPTSDGSPRPSADAESSLARRLFRRLKSGEAPLSASAGALPQGGEGERESVSRAAGNRATRLQKFIGSLPNAIGEGLSKLPKELGNGILVAASLPRELGGNIAGAIVTGLSGESEERRLQQLLRDSEPHRRIPTLAFTLMEWYERGAHPLAAQAHKAAAQWLTAVNTLTSTELAGLARLRNVQECAPLLLRKLSAVFDNQIQAAVAHVAAWVPEEAVGEDDLRDVCAATVERCMFPVVYETTISLYNDLYATQDQVIFQRASAFPDLLLATAELGVPEDFFPVARDLVRNAVLTPFLRAKTPSEKLEHLVHFLQNAYHSLQARCGESQILSADDLVPFLSLVMIIDQHHAPSRHLYSQVMFLTDFVSESTQMGLAGYAIVTARHSMVRILSLPSPKSNTVGNVYVSFLEPKPMTK